MDAKHTEFNVDNLQINHRSTTELGIKKINFSDLSFMKKRSKYLGKRFGNWVVMDYKLKNSYKKVYANGKMTTHNAISYLLVNDKGQYMELSGNSLRLISNGTRTFDQILNSNKKQKFLRSMN